MYHPSHFRRGILGFIFLGLGSLFWLIIRSAVKPSRLSYPCQKMAAANGTAFLAWTGTVAVGHPKKAAVFTLLLVSVFLAAAIFQIWDNTRKPAFIRAAGNSRVVWITNQSAARGWDGNTWENRANQATLYGMADQAIMALTGQSSVADAWAKLFKDHNGGADYQNGQKIVIKINDNNSCSYSSSGDHCPMIASVRALLRQLIRDKGILETNVTVYDASREVPDYLVDGIKRDFPGVRIGAGGNCGGESVWGAPLSRDLLDANYLINIPLLRTHGMAGVTLSFKNHLGSTCNPSAFHDSFFSAGAGSNGLVALNSNANIKNKTVLVMDDAVYALTQGGPDGKPNVLANSLFLATDPVAIDSVMIDYLESLIGFPPGNWMGDVRNYLRLGASSGLGNFATSCSGSNCTFSYANIDLVRCNPNCSGTPPPPTPVDILNLRQFLSQFTNIFSYNLIVGNFGK